jgi:plasmid maintenance system antidote protein VapI
VSQLVAIAIGGNTVTTQEKRPVYPIHPGKILADELAELQMSPAELAHELHVPSYS